MYPGERATRVAQKPGQLLGILDEPVLDRQTQVIPKGGKLLIYTDGLVDGISPQGERFGYKRLLTEVERWRDRPAQELCDRLLDRILEFQGDTHLQDDVTLVAITSFS
jgi:sigma-B regulation protein RsbU (phosphoserine phosphatase)